VRRLPGAAAALLALAGAACGPVPLPRRSAYHASDADVTITRIVHGSVLVDVGGTRVLVDPWFHSGFFTRQQEPLGLVPDGLPSVAAVVLTHAHGDRFDRQALHDLAARVPRVVAPTSLRDRLATLGFRDVTGLEWWEATRVGDLTVTAVPAPHGVPENGYVLEADGRSVYLAGDARYFAELADVATRFPDLDVALLSIGGERLLAFPRAMGPGDAARAAALLHPHRIIPIGYGETGGQPLRWFARRPVERFVEECTALGIDPARIVVLETGESWHLY
jgi:L-ascorbate metabolism protein UlaG (beta-lactamase superfamily)